MAVAIVAGCVSPPLPSPSPSGISPSPSRSGQPTDGSSVAPTLDGLLVASKGTLSVSDAAGALSRVAGPGLPVVEVSAAAGRAVVRDAKAGIWGTSDPLGPAEAWQAFVEPGAAPVGRPLFALSPGATELALANGTPQGQAFELEIRSLDPPGSQTIRIGHGMDGPPVWLGPSLVAIHVIREDQSGGFTTIDLATETVSDVTSHGYALGADGTGTLVAFDDATTGDVRVGSLKEMTDAEPGSLPLVSSGPPSSVERLALDAAGVRLAIVRRSDQGASIEILAMVDGTWTSLQTVDVPGDLGVAIAWLR
jgi:hypothetical protein